MPHDLLARRTCPPLVVLADDLSGAAECASVLPSCRNLVLAPAATPPPGEALVADLDTRRRTVTQASGLVAQAVRRHGAGGVRLLKKSDSLLRGHFAAETSAFAAGADGLVVAMALPAAGRTVRDGVVHLRGVPLHLTDAWHAEPGPPPRSVARTLGAPATVIPLTEIRAGLPHLEHRLRSGLADGAAMICDGETDADLDAVAETLLRLPETVRTIGSGGMAAALGRLSAPAEDRADPGRPRGGPRPVVVVVGTAHPGARAQIAQLTRRGAHHLVFHAASLLAHPDAGHPAAVTPTVPGRAPVLVFSIAPTPAADPSAAPHLARALARTVARLLPEDADLVLTGGETARSLLDELAVTSLLPVGQVHHGAVLCRTADGRGVVTRPGSFGGTDSLVRMVGALREQPGHEVPQTPHTSDGGPR
ncbi:four-carbon acid sugar kinase family protein [Streptomyces sp. QL37]|uniref:four-carbon acid sugar kinase family protein n=1 Tax=Streptomyces sp. QL37 TaxID=2093747 RepID=UPI0021CAFDAF|nr:four-carbon acid sugar kinase family protein [Streptomyces sp. QL37]